MITKGYLFDSPLGRVKALHFFSFTEKDFKMQVTSQDKICVYAAMCVVYLP